MGPPDDVVPAGHDSSFADMIPRDAEALVDMIVRDTMRQPQAHAYGEARYWLTF